MGKGSVPCAYRHTAQDNIVMEEVSNFPFDVSLLDDTVTDNLREGRSEHDDFSVFIAETSAEKIGDLDEVERTINDASVVTTVGGQYSLEREGGMVNVFFEAEAGETDKIQETFMTETEEAVGTGNIEEYEE